MIQLSALFKSVGLLQFSSIVGSCCVVSKRTFCSDASIEKKSIQM